MTVQTTPKEGQPVEPKAAPKRRQNHPATDAGAHGALQIAVKLKWKKWQRKFNSIKPEPT
jgi:hypothetical protein